MNRILVCDDDREIVEAIEIYLSQEGYEIVKAFDGIEALQKLENEDVQLVIMDVMMPRMDGIRAVRQIREKSGVPVIMLSAKSEDVDKIIGLNMGADDYVTKPFNPLELIARVKSQLRRYTSLGSQSQEEKKNLLINGGIVLDDEKKQVYVDGDEIRLTKMEYLILKLFMENPGRVYSTDEIYQNVWREDAIAADNTVAVHIRHLREKIEINPKEPRYLKVVWGIGYKMERERNVEK